MRILIIDDERNILKATALAVEAEGHLIRDGSPTRVGFLSGFVSIIFAEAIAGYKGNR